MATDSFSGAAIGQTAYCRNCSYDLRGQVEHRCPECGRPYDPADPKTFRRKPRGKAGKWIGRIAAGLVVLLLIASTPYAWLYYEWRQEQPAISRIKVLNGDIISYKRIDPPALCPLPERFGWMLKRLSGVRHTLLRHELDPFTDSDLILLARCRQLEELDAPESSVTDRGIAAISRLRDLRSLSVRGSGITDAAAAHLAGCQHLRSLDLRETSVTDVGLARLCALPELTCMNIESSRLTNAGLPSLANLPKLCQLFIRAPAIDDNGLATLARLPRVRWLVVRADHWTPAGEQRLRQALPKCDIKVKRYSADEQDQRNGMFYDTSSSCRDPERCRIDCMPWLPSSAFT